MNGKGGIFSYAKNGLKKIFLCIDLNPRHPRFCESSFFDETFF